MFVRFRFAAGALASLAGCAGSLLAQPAATPPAGENVVEIVQQAVTPPAGETAQPARRSLNRAVLFHYQPVVSADNAAVADTGEDLSGLWLGVQLAQEIPPALAHHLGETKGALIESVFPDSPAAETGLEPYDLIVRLGETPIASHEELVEAMKSVEEKPLDVVVLRGGEKKTVSLTPRTRQAPAVNLAAVNDYVIEAVPHVRMLPALQGADAQVFTRQMIDAVGGGAALPENIESLKIEWTRDGDKTVPKYEVVTVDGRIFAGAGEKDLNKLPPEIRAAIPQPSNIARFAIRLDPLPHNVLTVTRPDQVLPRQAPPIAPPHVAEVSPQVVQPGWVDIYRNSIAPAPPLVASMHGVTGASPQLEELTTEIKKLREALERIENRLQKDE